MYNIKRTKGFEKSLQKIRRSGFAKKNEVVLASVIDALALGKTLARKYKNHSLRGELRAYRECHILNDLLLLYKIEENELVLVLINVGSHSQLFK